MKINLSFAIADPMTYHISSKCLSYLFEYGKEGNAKDSSLLGLVIILFVGDIGSVRYHQGKTQSFLGRDLRRLATCGSLHGIKGRCMEILL